MLKILGFRTGVPLAVCGAILTVFSLKERAVAVEALWPEAGALLSTPGAQVASQHCGSQCYLTVALLRNSPQN